MVPVGGSKGIVRFWQVPYLWLVDVIPAPATSHFPTRFCRSYRPSNLTRDTNTVSRDARRRVHHTVSRITDTFCLFHLIIGDQGQGKQKPPGLPSYLPGPLACIRVGRRSVSAAACELRKLYPSNKGSSLFDFTREHHHLTRAAASYYLLTLFEAK